MAVDATGSVTTGLLLLGMAMLGCGVVAARGLVTRPQRRRPRSSPPAPDLRMCRRVLLFDDAARPEQTAGRG